MTNLKSVIKSRHTTLPTKICLDKAMLLPIVMYGYEFSCSVVSNSLRPHGLQHARLPCPLLTPRAVQTNIHRVSDAIQPSHPVISFSFCLQSFPASESFPMSQFFASGGQSIGVSASASVLPIFRTNFL